MIVYGPGIKAGMRQERVAPLAVASVLSHGLNIPVPARAEHAVPEGLFVSP